jgi:hypothetical protein
MLIYFVQVIPLSLPVLPMVGISGKSRLSTRIPRRLEPHDEPVNHQVHSTMYVEDYDNISFAMSKNKIFIRANMCNNEKKIVDRSCVLIGSILLKNKEFKDHVMVL